VWPVVILFATGFALAPFVHGTFTFLGEYVQALNALTGEAQTVVTNMLTRHRQLLAISYGVIIVNILLASIWFSAAVLMGGTRFPTWMAAINPLSTLMVWLVMRRLLTRLGDWLEGAGFNLAFLGFFGCITFTLWQG
jgi:hypothetical protein